MKELVYTTGKLLVVDTYEITAVDEKIHALIFMLAQQEIREREEGK